MQKVTKERLFELLLARHKDNPYAKLSNLPNPFLLKDLPKAVKRIKSAILNNEAITIVGDYDVDGVVSTTIMVDFFNKVGYKINHIIPNRFEHGYGLSTKIVDLIDTGLVITVDNGISAVEASKKLKEKNIDLIITDHHTVGKTLPEAFAIINPKQYDCTFPFKEICGAQVAWYLCAGIKKELNLDINMSDFFDLLCVAIVADIMPMTDLNYTLVRHGLKSIKNSNRPAFKKLNEVFAKKFYVSDDIGFMIAPKINSAGRMDDASIALSFLLSKNDIEANESLTLLDELNNYRKSLQEMITKKATNEIIHKHNAIVVWGENWHEGVIGIVASKLSNKYKKPAFVFSINNGVAKGSARANAKINLHTLISKCSSLLIGFGGHKNAAGLSLKQENLKRFQEEINLYLANTSKEDLHIKYECLGELDVSSVDLEFLSIIEKFEPYGLENKKPIFKITNSKVLKIEFIGKDKNHLKILLNNDGFIFEALKFHHNEPINEEFIDLIVTINKNEFRGEVNTQFLIEDILL
ncbi:single-stranded-DNA-specific exonuclease RecJ [Malaciobacter molluscorum LMG 25693]|uniref:Single-stranded-DNA-specific exonuclease RecJ n=1 Tax=Malaciobacter molluscorum LMG 25693 TaxID=870501 RepID=A0A2G1DFV7_9BACT|nr:single-stranded-DNA-specific exonuclease RecJ [Malaciobacter molluscorum]AXX93627.1 single-stranded DNA-specific exonuclease [Malaciobacter molluscorum LMG 25693]PHO17334.1 single-stranded-DNA-specific exonuclease RecJ [Malaciobacter molluscorum LMG 25693]